jgi:hypothetical protein
MSSHSGLATVSAMWSANDSGQSRSVSDALRLVIPSGVTASSIRSSGPLLGIHNGRAVDRFLEDSEASASAR